MEMESGKRERWEGQTGEGQTREGSSLFFLAPKQIEEAAAALMMVIGLTETGVDALGELMCCAWRRVVRFGYDESQRTDAELPRRARSTMYLFNGATYEAIVGRDKHDESACYRVSRRLRAPL